MLLALTACQTPAPPPAVDEPATAPMHPSTVECVELSSTVDDVTLHDAVLILAHEDWLLLDSDSPALAQVSGDLLAFPSGRLTAGIPIHDHDHSATASMLREAARVGWAEGCEDRARFEFSPRECTTKERKWAKRLAGLSEGSAPSPTPRPAPRAGGG